MCPWGRNTFSFICARSAIIVKTKDSPGLQSRISRTLPLYPQPRVLCAEEESPKYCYTILGLTRGLRNSMNAIQCSTDPQGSDDGGGSSLRNRSKANMSPIKDASQSVLVEQAPRYAIRKKASLHETFWLFPRSGRKPLRPSLQSSKSTRTRALLYFWHRAVIPCMKRVCVLGGSSRLRLLIDVNFSTPTGDNAQNPA